ncbi:DegV family protein [Spiroplasma sabaudiense Ar-1343]|uniref:DegV family protein n=1 Tax=Spiroplasma sabaudiense Ar-1343 TaxID=1276257 RepID=W6AAR0_9MOLU|nr:DegV family protein [Spiroplasma sabaudiense]AHI54101.1 DegV family protein [Spiroplasma sabaudiense Ar-1343]
MKIAILTDSSFDGNKKDFKDLFVVPLMISRDNAEQIKDDEQLSFDEFYKMLEKEKLKTSQTIPEDMLTAWDNLLKEYDQVIVALLSKGLSGQFNTATMLAKDEPYNGKIFVVDTNGVSSVLTREIEQISKWIEAGKTGPEIKELVESELNNKFTTFIIPKNLEVLKRGGRIKPAAAALAKLLKITPILRYDGEIDKFGTTRTFKKAVKEVLEKIKEECPGIEKIDISYSKSDDSVLEMVKEVVAESGLKIDIFCQLSNVIATHTGTETFAFIGWKK